MFQGNIKNILFFSNRTSTVHMIPRSLKFIFKFFRRSDNRENVKTLKIRIVEKIKMGSFHIIRCY